MTANKPRPPFGNKWIALFLLLGCASIAFFLFRPRPVEKITLPEVPRNDLTLRDGRLYRPNQTAPFTGFMIEFYDDGALKSRSVISNGMLNGVSEGWHTNGVLQVREHFTNSVSHGLREKWHDNGTKLSEATIVNGKIEGTFLRWDENGQLAEQIQMKESEPDGMAWSFYPSGFLKTEARLKNGKLIEKKSWNDGEQMPLVSEKKK